MLLAQRRFLAQKGYSEAKIEDRSYTSKAENREVTITAVFRKGCGELLVSNFLHENVLFVEKEKHRRRFKKLVVCDLSEDPETFHRSILKLLCMAHRFL